MPQVSEITVYPIKSLSGISLSQAMVQPRGLQFDRRWMLVEADGSFITQRDDPSLVRFKVSLTEQGLEVSAPDFLPCPIPFQGEGRDMHVRVWNSELPATMVSDHVDAWFSAALGRQCHLVAMPEDASRTINPAFGDSPVSFADAMPILVLSEASLQDLNERLEQPVPANRFRANILVRGLKAFEEESITQIAVGNLVLQPTKRCGRCLVTCTDQTTGERGTEPLRTLAKYRTFNNNACMGMYFFATSTGSLNVGDQLIISN